MGKAKHCLDCGDTHSGDCDPRSFEYFQCENCTRKQMLPWDAVALVGLGGIQCGCGKPADANWKSLTHEQYLAAVEQRKKS